MELIDVLSADRVVLDATGSSKKNLLEMAARLLADADAEVDERVIFESLCQRERLGSTGLGGGVAIPHARVQNQSELRACLIRLRHPVSFDAPDAKPVDTVLALAMPTEAIDGEQALLAKMAATLQMPAVLTSIRTARHSDDVLQRLSAAEDDAS